MKGTYSWPIITQQSYADFTSTMSIRSAVGVLQRNSTRFQQKNSGWGRSRIECIILHSCFPSVCLNPQVLQTVYLSCQQQYGINSTRGAIKDCMLISIQSFINYSDQIHTHSLLQEIPTCCLLPTDLTCYSSKWLGREKSSIVIILLNKTQT